MVSNYDKINITSNNRTFSKEYSSGENGKLICTAVITQYTDNKKFKPDINFNQKINEEEFKVKINYEKTNKYGKSENLSLNDITNLSNFFETVRIAACCWYSTSSEYLI